MRTPKRTFLILVSIALSGAAPLFAGSSTANDEQSLWQALADGGHVALMRHAMAPGTGDPPQFVLGDCRTQRNLSEQGRVQANDLGDRFRANGITSAQVISSQWCRCLETARLLDLGGVEPNQALNSFFRDNTEESERTAAALAMIRSETNADRPMVLVTHQVNITALTGIFPASGEIVVVRPSADGIETIGRIR
ncbi:MAG: histidine phosphatase family protein [Thiohalocapsa sp.]